MPDKPQPEATVYYARPQVLCRCSVHRRGLRSEAGRPEFSAQRPGELLTWSNDFGQSLDCSKSSFANWFVGGEFKAAYNTPDCHVENWPGNRVALHFELEPGDASTFPQLTEKEAILADAGESMSAAKCNRGAMNVPLIRDSAITRPAWTRIGAVLQAATFYDDPEMHAQAFRILREAVVGIKVDAIPRRRLTERGR